MKHSASRPDVNVRASRRGRWSFGRILAASVAAHAALAALAIHALGSTLS